jgi:hypothetical protein
MTNQHSLTPPLELVQQWWLEANYNEPIFEQVAAIAAQWGADQELDACCKWLGPLGIKGGDNLRRARRPKPPTLKEQALESVKRFEKSGEFFSDQMRELEFIRKALETLPND